MPDDMRYYRLICLIAKAEIANKAEGILSERGIDVEYRMLVHGTASSEMMNLLGLGTTEKVMISAIATQEGASELLPQMRKRLYLGMPDTGVAFTIPITGGQNRLFENVSANAKDSGRMEVMEDREFSMIIAIVNQGFSDAVMNAARPEGATGGTVFHSRRVENSMPGRSFWGISIQEERETVMILARNSRKKEIMKAISEKCGIDTESNGIVFSVPIADVEGLG